MNEKRKEQLKKQIAPSSWAPIILIPEYFLLAQKQYTLHGKTYTLWFAWFNQGFLKNKQFISMMSHPYYKPYISCLMGVVYHLKWLSILYDNKTPVLHTFTDGAIHYILRLWVSIDKGWLGPSFTRNGKVTEFEDFSSSSRWGSMLIISNSDQPFPASDNYKSQAAFCQGDMYVQTVACGEFLRRSEDTKILIEYVGNIGENVQQYLTEYPMDSKEEKIVLKQKNKIENPVEHYKSIVKANPSLDQLKIDHILISQLYPSHKPLFQLQGQDFSVGCTMMMCLLFYTFPKLTTNIGYISLINAAAIGGCLCYIRSAEISGLIVKDSKGNLMNSDDCKLITDIQSDDIKFFYP
jgi:hypothetical protein